MIKIIFFIFIIFTYSCRDTVKKQDTGLMYMNSKITIIIIDSCEYINFGTSNVLTHKGNCKNHKK